MGWNQGFDIFEETVIGVYNVGKLDKDLLEVLASPYRDTDIDTGNYNEKKANDCKTVLQIVIETAGLEYPNRPDVPDDWRKQSYEQSAALEKWSDTVWEMFHSVVKW